MDPAVLLSSNQLQQIGCGMDVTPPFSKNFLQVGMYVCTYVYIYIYATPPLTYPRFVLELSGIVIVSLQIFAISTVLGHM